MSRPLVTEGMQEMVKRQLNDSFLVDELLVFLLLLRSFKLVW